MEKQLQEQIDRIKELNERFGLPGIDDKNGFKVPKEAKEQEEPEVDISEEDEETKKEETKEWVGKGLNGSNEPDDDDIGKVNDNASNDEFELGEMENYNIDERNGFMVTPEDKK